MLVHVDGLERDKVPVGVLRSLARTRLLFHRMLSVAS